MKRIAGSSRNNSRGNSRRGRAGRRSPNGSANLPVAAPTTQAPANIPVQPNFYPRVCVSRMVDGLIDITATAIAPGLNSFAFTLSMVPGFAEFQAMWTHFCLEKIEIWYRPEYTVLSDSGVASTAINVEFYSVVDFDTNAAAISDLQQYQNCAHTPITKVHYRKFKPSFLGYNGDPMCALVPTSQSALRWYGLKVGVPPCGTTMTFRSTIKFTIALAGLK